MENEKKQPIFWSRKFGKFGVIAEFIVILAFMIVCIVTHEEILSYICLAGAVSLALSFVVEFPLVTRGLGWTSAEKE